MALEDPFIGRGWAFPPSFDAARASAVMAEGIADIEQSLRIIFSTALGERLMRPDFGAALDGELFAAMNTTRLAWIEQMARDAILFHEPRIDAEDISVAFDAPAGRLDLTVVYRVRGVNSRFNMVLPYYLPEAGNAGI
ncbi:MAG: GPW/gp25 family protein [Rhodobacteraceae bacterium]|nr:GPW/gp25 family protein [Paracoccaceae bacterium]